MYVEREQDVLRAASMYYLQDLKMEVIARHLGTSRSTVSRLIKRARQAGLVEITLRPASTRAPGLAQQLDAAPQLTERDGVQRRTERGRPLHQVVADLFLDGDDGHVVAEGTSGIEDEEGKLAVAGDEANWSHECRMPAACQPTA